MIRLIFLGLVCIFFASCSGKKQSANTTIQTKPSRFYDFNIGIDIMNPFLGLESRFLIINSGTELYDERNGSIVSIKEARPNVLYFITYKRSSIKQNRNKNISDAVDTTFTKLSKSQLDTIYNLTSKLFNIDKETNITNDFIPPPPVGDYNNAIVTFELKFRGDNYSRHVKKTSEASFSELYNYLSSKQNSR